MITYLLTDIEGTTTSISFVVDTLFPYFLEHLDEVRDRKDEAFVREQLEHVKATVKEEEQQVIDDEQAIGYLETWCKEDRKHPALKALQGLIWKAGYRNGQLKGHVYAEVPAALRQWKDSGKELGIYSSGSVAAQKLLFGHSEAGDLTPLFSHYFDTAVGHKRETQSYQNIQQEIDRPASEILFLSDVEPELDAARQASMHTVKLVRPGTGPASKHATVGAFDEIDLSKF